MDHEETKLIVAGLLELSDIAERLNALHKYVTNFLIQKGVAREKSRKKPFDPDYNADGNLN